MKKSILKAAAATAAILATTALPGLGAGIADYRTTSNPYYQAKMGGQCTSYAWGRFFEKNSISLNFYGSPSMTNPGKTSNWPSAIFWKSAVITSSQVKVLSASATPVPGSVAVWSDAGSHTDAYGRPLRSDGVTLAFGHVGFVERVVGDTVYFTEANFSNYVDTYYGGGVENNGAEKAFSMSNFRSRGKYQLVGYIAPVVPNTAPVIQQATVSYSRTSGNLDVSFYASDKENNLKGWELWLEGGAGPVRGTTRTYNRASNGYVSARLTAQDLAAFRLASGTYKVGIRLIDQQDLSHRLIPPYSFSYTAAQGANGDIQVTGLSSRTIHSGDLSPSTVDGTDFGKVRRNAYKQVTFRIWNVGSSPLTIKSLARSGSSNFAVSGMTLSNNLNLTISPNSSRAITVTYYARSITSETADLIIGNDSRDSSEVSYRFRLAARGY